MRRSSIWLRIGLTAVLAGAAGAAVAWGFGNGAYGTASAGGVAVAAALAGALAGTGGGPRGSALPRLGVAQVKALLDHAPARITLKDTDGRFVLVNRHVEGWFGLKADLMVGRHTTEIFPPELARLYDAADKLVLTSGRPQQSHFAHPREGREVHSSVLKFPARADDGSIFGVWSIGTDVTDRREAERALLDAKEAAERANHLKSAFLAAMSHELRTPLTSIAGSLGLLGAGAVGPLGEKATRLVSIAHSNCERLIRLINDILDIEKIESGTMEFDLRRMQVRPLIQRTVGALAGFAEQHAVTVETSLPPWPQCVSGDPDRLEQLLTNLISNAIKHSPQGGTVEVIPQQSGADVRIEVRDRGEGIPQAFRQRIFGKFAMADASDRRSKGGSGLGLSIAREIARRHGGDIGFDDREGGGTVFYVTLPLLDDSSLPVSGPDRSRDLPSILHVDDDHDCLSVVASAFGDRAHVVSAASLEEAAERIARDDLAAAIVDVGLNREDGLSLLPGLRRAGIPVVLFTARDHAHQGADAVLIKSRSSIGDLVGTTMDIIAVREAA